VAQFTLLHQAKADEAETKPDGKHISPMRLVLKAPDRRQMLSVQLADRLIVGRSGNGRDPDIDLTELDAARYGLSRWHAVLTFDDAELCVEDLNSTNGTRINGYKLDAGRAYRLRNGDELELGRLRLIVQVVRPPS
jgi:pSer/pThr/pTyr-binding forkhead associated (FHA) protein